MSTTTFFVVAIVSIFATNLLPAFGPPTWALLVFFKFNGDLALAPLVVGGAVASTSGRYLLARGSHRVRHRFSPERIEHLSEAQAALTRHRATAIGGLALFVLSPLPSAQLFVAAGLLSLPLPPLAGAFFLGRLVSYTLYLGGATLAYGSLSDTLTGAFTSPVGIATQVGLVAAVVALIEVDWAGWISRAPGIRGDRGGGEIAPDDAPPATVEHRSAGPHNDDGRPEGRPSEPVA